MCRYNILKYCTVCVCVCVCVVRVWVRYHQFRYLLLLTGPQKEMSPILCYHVNFIIIINKPQCARARGLCVSVCLSVSSDLGSY